MAHHQYALCSLIIRSKSQHAVICASLSRQQHHNRPLSFPMSLGAPRKRNLLIVVSSLWVGGAETVVRHLAETIDRSRFNVTVCHLKQRGSVGDEMVRAGIDVVGVPEARGRKIDYLTFRKLRKVIRERNIDVVHTHTTHALVDASLCKVLKPRLKVIHTFHFGNYPHTERRVLPLERLFSSVPDRLFAVGEAQGEQIRSVFRFPPGRLEVVRNGVRVPCGRGDPGFRRRIGAENRFLIGTIATLIEQKGLRDLLQVARRVRDAGHDAIFVIIGEGHLRKELEVMRHDLGLDDSVVLTGWMTNAADLALPSFDVFFQPSHWEAMSMVLLEAMATGRPIVATRVGENPYVIADGVDGILVDAHDVEGQAIALTRLISDSRLRDSLGAVAERKIAAHFTVDHMTKAYERVYEDLTL